MADDFGEAETTLCGVVALVTSGSCWLLARHQRSQAAVLKTTHPCKAFTSVSCGSDVPGKGVDIKTLLLT